MTVGLARWITELYRPTLERIEERAADLEWLCDDEPGKTVTFEIVD